MNGHTLCRHCVPKMACPVCYESERIEKEKRATLRDQFAMAAPEAPGRHKWEFEIEEEEAAADAEWRYIHADAMMKARESGGEGE